MKKIKVESHVQKCRQCQCLSCMDCGKDFWGNDYKAHNACITEEEKYSGKNYQPKVNKGEQKQEMWLEAIRSTIATTTEPKLKNVLEHLLTFNNIPRKRNKFENFLRASAHIKSPGLINEVWQVFSSVTETPKNQSSNIIPQATDIQPSQNNINAVDSSENKAKKNKRELKEERKKKAKVEKKDKNVENQHSNGIQNLDSKIELNEESTTKENLNKIKKHKKKRKHQMNDEDVANTETDITPHEEDLSEITIIETKKKAKALEDRSSNDIQNRDGEFEPNQENTTKENLNKVKKHKKKQKHQINDEDVANSDTAPHEGTIPEIVITEKKKKDKKRRLSDTIGDDTEKEVSIEEPANKKQKGEEISERFLWVPVIRAILEKAENKELSVKKVKKKVVAEYISRCQGKIITKEEIQAKLLKRIERNPIFRLHKERIKLIEN